MNENQASAAQAVKAANLREKLIQLPQSQQEAVANYFNMYNCAAWLFNEVLSQDARNYVDQSISYARELQQLEALQETPNDKVFDDQVKALNNGEEN